MHEDTPDTPPPSNLPGKVDSGHEDTGHEEDAAEGYFSCGQFLDEDPPMDDAPSPGAEGDEDTGLNPEWFLEIRNANEERVRALLPDVLADYPEYQATQQDLRDIYACALNKLPARYQQPGTPPRADPVTEAQIRDRIETAVITVLIRPRSDRSTVFLKREAAERRTVSRDALPG